MPCFLLRGPGQNHQGALGDPKTVSGPTEVEPAKQGFLRTCSLSLWHPQLEPLEVAASSSQLGSASGPPGPDWGVLWSLQHLIGRCFSASSIWLGGAQWLGLCFFHQKGHSSPQDSFTESSFQYPLLFFFFYSLAQGLMKAMDAHKLAL